MAFNAYLVFGTPSGSRNIGGESTSEVATGLSGPDPATGDLSSLEGCKGAIEVTDYSFGVNMAVTTGRSDGGGATVGRANFDVFTCTKNIDTATVPLVEYCCKGTAIPKIALHLFRSSAGTASTTGVVKYCVIYFGNCVITKCAVSGGGDDLPKESLEFNYGQVQYCYRYTNHNNGAPGSDIKTGWSLVANKQADSAEKPFSEEKVSAPSTSNWS